MKYALQGERRNVLIVDDDADMRDILHTALTGLGFTTYIAEDGDVALSIYLEYRPDLVLSDVYMPRFDGIRLLREIKKISSDTPVILITGFSNSDAFCDSEGENGVRPDAVLRKPFNLHTLIETIGQVLEM